MSLLKLPPLPEGLHPYISIFKDSDSSSKKDMYIFSSDSPQYVQRVNYKYYIKNVDAIHKYSYNDKIWSIRTYLPSIYMSDLMYTNHDMLNYNDEKTVALSKTPDATGIKIEGGNARALRKGMVWNVGESISILPVNAFQSATFESSNPAVCTVDETGKIKAVGEGDCIITITTR
ncbi:Ig-like domain-containing protein [Clostridium botulinum]|uniref:Ig-like domain-containing protein n=1 Tax=Clostridium botulinum TaxID=1491 RepID=UPI000699857D|nr:hypothetical protein [Clostridium botulinum]KOA90877.1 hypothetical protein ADU76_12550 [Clostridium botulinum]MCD3203441.1 hypothetical protein [Clostridium botulinum C/D]MCD3222304.1 hypothetical protein [Clostridium botulinum C/D]MCD3231425.1 hypothetical protein [Clostridium botulinum C/D]MCD3273077.1 hypothetical protein [Clostridium botulinum C/D]